MTATDWSQRLDFIDIAETLAYKGMGTLALTDANFEARPGTSLTFERQENSCEQSL